MLRLLLLIAVLAGASAAAHATDEPDLVRSFIDKASASCVAAGGRAEPKPAITSLDLNGDGHPDWIVHYSGFCLDAPNQSCVAGSCVIEIFLGQPDGGVKLFLMQSTISWRTDRLLGKPALIFRRPSEFCRDRKQRICDEKYIFDRGRFRHLPYS